MMLLGFVQARAYGGARMGKVRKKRRKKGSKGNCLEGTTEKEKEEQKGTTDFLKKKFLL